MWMRLDSGSILWCNNACRETAQCSVLYHITKSAPGCCRTINGGFFFICGNRYNFRMRVPSLTRWGIPTNAPEVGYGTCSREKRGRGCGQQQGGKAEQIRATRYHVTQTEGGEISREQRAEPIAESRACTRCTSAGARNHISPRESAERKRRASEPLYSGVHHARLNAAFRPVHSSTVGCMTQNCKRVHFSLAGCTKGCTRTT